MPKKTSIRAWDSLRLGLLWARKAGVFRNRLVINLNLLQKGIKKLRQSHEASAGALVYGDRQFSFDDTPIIHVKMHRPSSLRFKMPHIPCIKPHVDFDYDFEFDDDDNYDYVKERRSFLKEKEEEEDDSDDDEGIDLKAEEFIANFYEQMKLQRQISYLHYNDNTST